MKLLYCFLLLGASLLPRLGAAQDFVYEPKNPAFGGGNTFNYSWLLSAATAQNTTVDPSQTATQGDALSQFSANLNQQVLSQLTNRLISSQFGSGAIKAGAYTVGSYQVQVTPGSGGVVIVVTDTGTGNQTTVTIPNGL
ncbi:curli production assembly/transport component CsgF [Hymenobacter sp. HMF4947]|uniref:Curli production assembly/transport component CsgF n=1 Tax=Hymenobacter ginkgonis TaxID=2682976 RepID=A0A7K1TCC4_9BACT|nr:curli production assembly/transport component CsgF [Hymenobacter ginkgonis]MVN75972.1 curli production assembly/transport component CsgF [Hymenobacter ginkgonis]